MEPTHQPQTQPSFQKDSQDDRRGPPFTTHGIRVPRRVRQQLFAALPPEADYVHLLSYEGAAHVGYRCTAVGRTADDDWFFAVVTRRLLFGRTERLQEISQGTARALVSAVALASA